MEPPGFSAISTRVPGLPSDWTLRWSKSKQTAYYFSPSTGQTSWTAPPETVQPALRGVTAFLSAPPSGPPAPVDPSLEKFRHAHILFKHTKSRNPMRPKKPREWVGEPARDAEKVTVRISPEDARAKIEGLRAELVRAGDDADGRLFQLMALLESNCSSGVDTCGELEAFTTKSSFVPDYEAAVKALQPGEMSPVFASPSGWHIVKRLPTSDPCIDSGDNSACFHYKPDCTFPWKGTLYNPKLMASFGDERQVLEYLFKHKDGPALMRSRR